ncbi:hypothetical protein L1887_15111 [Cichorium endivia]|nr:hypothetical protein L1887_15111 [Cichorium endivia]
MYFTLSLFDPLKCSQAGESKRRHRHKPSTQALREIRHLQKTVNLLIPVAPFIRTCDGLPTLLFFSTGNKSFNPGHVSWIAKLESSQTELKNSLHEVDDRQKEPKSMTEKATKDMETLKEEIQGIVEAISGSIIVIYLKDTFYDKAEALVGVYKDSERGIK